MELKICVFRQLAIMLAVRFAMAATACISTAAAAEKAVVVFAAASATNAITEIGESFFTRGLGCIKPSFASSSTLAKQIANGAPADVYVSANEKWMDYLEEKHLLSEGSRFDLLGNRIVLIAPVDSPLGPIDVARGFALAPLLGRDGRLAMGDPDHVPAGMYGRESLQSLDIWDQVKNRLAPMKDVRAALVLVERGEAPLGLVYGTDALISKKVRVVGSFPAGSHPPIVYPVAAVEGGKTAEARQFIDFLKSSETRAVFEKYGFDVR